MRHVTALKIAVVQSGRHQKDIAAELGIDPGTFSRIVNGWHPPEETRSRIAQALGRHIEELWPEQRVAS